MAIFVNFNKNSVTGKTFVELVNKTDAGYETVRLSGSVLKAIEVELIDMGVEPRIYTPKGVEAVPATKAPAKAKALPLAEQEGDSPL